MGSSYRSSPSVISPPRSFSVVKLGGEHREMWQHFCETSGVFLQLEDGQIVDREHDFSWELVSPFRFVFGIFNVGELIGFVRFEVKGTLHLEVHLGIAPEGRGRKMLGVLEEVTRQMKAQSANSPVMLEAVIPSCNKGARMMALWAGMKPVGLVPHCWLKDGQLWHKHIYARTL